MILSATICPGHRSVLLDIFLGKTTATMYYKNDRDGDDFKTYKGVLLYCRPPSQLLLIAAYKLYVRRVK